VQAPATGLYANLGDGAYRVGFRAHQLEVANGIAGRHAFSATVTVTEITGSESFVHLNRDDSNWVAVLQGVHEFPPGHVLDAVLDPDNLFVFDAAGRLVAAPIALSSEVRGGSREENASKKDSGGVRDMQHGPH
jgi:glycerol transport system ATP-binding protein